MKKLKQQPATGNGIKISYNRDSALSNVEKARIPLFNELMLVILQILTGIGGIMTLVTIMGLKVNSAAVISTIVVSAFVYTCAFKLIKKRIWVILGVLLLSAIFVLFTFGHLQKGFGFMYDQAQTTISAYMYRDAPKFDYEWTNDLRVYNTLTCCAAAAFYMCFVSFFTVVRISFIAIFLLTFPCFEIGAAFGCVPNYYYFAMMLASWSASIALHQANNVKVKVKKRNGRRTTNHVFSSNSVRFAGSSLIVALITIGLFFGGRSVLNSMGFARPEKIESLRKEVKDRADETIDYITGEDRDGSMKEGQLLKVDDHNVKDRHYITMETSLVEISEPIYLKGYNATYYKNNQWHQYEDYNEYKRLFERLNGFSYRIPCINGSLLSNTPDSDTYEATRITLSDFRRVKDYTYMMYNSDFDDTYTENYDITMKAKNQKEYGFNAYVKSEYIFEIAKSKIYKSNLYQEIWSDYAHFVNKEYVNSTQTTAVEDIVAGFENKNKYALVDEIRTYLSDNIKYTFIVDKSPADKDFVEHFLTNTKRGYSTHYATAAAVMLQEAGVPARYVEGYCILPTIFNKTKTDNKYGYKTIDVTDAYAHAWVEIFDEKFGWIPVEFTPTYYSGSFEDYIKDHIPELDEPEEEKPEIPNEVPEDSYEYDEDYDYSGDVGDVGASEEEIVYTSEEEEEPPAPEKKDYTLLIVLIGVCVLLFLIAFFFLSYFIIIRFMSKQLKTGSTNLRAYHAFCYLIRIAKGCGIDITYSSYQELLDKLSVGFNFAGNYIADAAKNCGLNTESNSYKELIEKIVEETKFVDSENLNKVFSIIMKSGFSGSEITEEETEYVVTSVKNYAVNAYKTRKGFGKFKFKFIYHLI